MNGIKSEIHTIDHALFETRNRPHMFYVAVMNCKDKLTNKMYGVPRFSTQVWMYNMIDGEKSHFSYEDMGSL